MAKKEQESEEQIEYIDLTKNQIDYLAALEQNIIATQTTFATACTAIVSGCELEGRPQEWEIAGITEGQLVVRRKQEE